MVQYEAYIPAIPVHHRRRCEQIYLPALCLGYGIAQYRKSTCRFFALKREVAARFIGIRGICKEADSFRYLAVRPVFDGGIIPTAVCLPANKLVVHAIRRCGAFVEISACEVGEDAYVYRNDTVAYLAIALVSGVPLSKSMGVLPCVTRP